MEKTNIEITVLRPSRLNPREIQDNQKYEEFKQTIKERGIITPLIVRPVEGLGPGSSLRRYEIVSGHRRFKAAQELGLKEVPVRIKPMNDEEALDVMTIENLQREDLHPLDEAKGYRRLLKTANRSVPDVAAAVGKDHNHVYKILRLLELTPKIQEGFLKQKILLGHALSLARLQPKDQEEVYKWIFAYNRDACSVRNLDEHIKDHVLLDLNKSSFSKTECAKCQKRTGFVPALFPDLKKEDMCTDSVCFKTKQEEYLKDRFQELQKGSDKPIVKISTMWGSSNEKGKGILFNNDYHEIRKGDKHCDQEVTGLVVAGHDIGKSMTICPSGKGCKIHSGRYHATPQEKARRQADKDKIQANRIIREKILEAILPKAKLDIETLRVIALEQWNRLWHDHKKPILDRHGLKPIKGQYGSDYEIPLQKVIRECKPKDLTQIMVEISLAPSVWTGLNYDGYNRTPKDSLKEMATHYSVDAKAIEKEVQSQFKAKAKQRTLRLRKKEPKGKKIQSGVCRYCGCTEENACEGGCTWVDKKKTICSACVKGRRAIL